MSKMLNKSLALGVAAALTVAGAFALGATSPSQAAPVFAHPLALKEAAPSDVIEVRRRWRRHRGAAVAGLALGIIGAAIAAQHYRGHHYHYYHYPRRHIYYYAPRRAPRCIRHHGHVYCR